LSSAITRGTAASTADALTLMVSISREPQTALEVNLGSKMGGNPEPHRLPKKWLSGSVFENAQRMHQQAAPTHIRLRSALIGSTLAKIFP